MTRGAGTATVTTCGCTRSGPGPTRPGRSPTLSSVAGHHVDAVDDAGDVAQQLQQEGPEHPPGRPLVDEHGQEWQEETQNDQENLAHHLADLHRRCADASLRDTRTRPGKPGDAVSIDAWQIC